MSIYNSFAQEFMILAVIFASYFVPFIIALSRDLKNKGSIFVLNLFFGWTLIGWVGALCWSIAGTAEIKQIGVRR